MSNRFARFSAILSLVALPIPAALADDNNHLIMTETPSGLTISLELLGTDYGTLFLGINHPTGSTTWFSDHYTPILYPEHIGLVFAPSLGIFTTGFIDSTAFVNWVEPDDPTEYNVLQIAPNGNNGNLSFVISSDVPGPADGEQYVPADGSALLVNACTDDSAAAISCPVLTNNQSYEVPLLGLAATFFNDGTLTVQFNDLGDAVTTAVPEPGSLALITSGLGALAMIRRRRSIQ